MHIYDAIYLRKSVRAYKNEEIQENVLNSIREFYENVQNLFLGIETELDIIHNTGKNHSVGLYAVKAPYYLAIYSQDNEKSMMNAGYIMEQLSLFLCTKGLGSCYVGTPFVKSAWKMRNGKHLMMLLAFGKAKGSAVRKPIEAKRLELDAICVFKETMHHGMEQILEAARMAPSSFNNQPWRFVVYDRRIHVFSKKGRRIRNHFTEFDFGIMFAHMMIAAEELWMDVDLIRLEDISQKMFKNTQYVLSAVINS